MSRLRGAPGTNVTAQGVFNACFFDWGYLFFARASVVDFSLSQ